MITLDVIRNIVLLSTIKNLFKEQAAWFYWEELDHKLWINTLSKSSQKKIAQKLTSLGLVQPSQIQMLEHNDTIAVSIPKVKDIKEIRNLITDQLDSGCKITDPDFSVKLLFKGVLIDSYFVDYGDLDTPLKLSVSLLFNPEESVEMCFTALKPKTKYDINNEGYLMLDGKQTNILLNLTYRNIVHNHYMCYGMPPIEFTKWAISPDKHLAVAATKHLLFIWNDECVDGSSVIVIPVTYYEAHLSYYPECIQIYDSEQFIVKSNGIHYTYNKKGELIATSA